MNLSLIVGPESAAIFLNADQNLRALTVNESSPGRQSFNLFTPSTPGAFRSVRVSVAETTKAGLWAAISNANRATAPDHQDGIYDSGLPSHPNSGIGLAKLADAHGDSYLLIRPTRIGDLNLDGTVSIADFIELAAHFNQSGADITWQEGDVNYDNTVSIADFIELSSNFNGSYSGAVSPTSIPEPAAGFLLLGLTAIGHRPRRRRLF